jgi:hypothetical protein
MDVLPFKLSPKAPLRKVGRFFAGWLGQSLIGTSLAHDRHGKLFAVMLSIL